MKSDYHRSKSDYSTIHARSYFRSKKNEINFLKGRYSLVLLVLTAVAIALISRMVYLTVDDHNFLLGQGFHAKP